jgi:hypothetical protein
VNTSGSEPICPICAAPVAAVPSRCSVCTVRIDSAGRAAGWRGGDPVAAGMALRGLPASPFEAAGPIVVGFDTTGGRCGTKQGYFMHQSRKEERCAPCKRAYADWRAELRAQKRAA